MPSPDAAETPARTFSLGSDPTAAAGRSGRPGTAGDGRRRGYDEQFTIPPGPSPTPGPQPSGVLFPGQREQLNDRRTGRSAGETLDRVS